MVAARREVRFEDLDLGRHLPIDFLLSPEEHKELVDLFFENFAFWGPRGYREAFDCAMQDALSPTPIPAPKTSSTSTSVPTTPSSVHYSPMLHNAMLALAMAFSNEPHLRNLDNRMKFVAKARSYALEEMEVPTLSGILAFSYLSSFFSGTGQHSAASSYFGQCATMAQTCEYLLPC